MACDTYSVWVGNILLADAMSIEHALLFIEALFQKYWNDPVGFYTIKKNKQNEENVIASIFNQMNNGDNEVGE